MSQAFIATQTRSISESIILSQTESEFARDRRAAGARIIESKNQFWWETHLGFYQALNWLTRMPAAQAVQPALFCWAYRTTLAEDDSAAANGIIPVNLLQDISQYDLEHLPSSRRYDLRKSRNLVTIVELTGPELLRAEGYEVLRSSWVRTSYGSMPTKDAYQAAIAQTALTSEIAPVLAKAQAALNSASTTTALANQVKSDAIAATSATSATIISASTLSTDTKSLTATPPSITDVSNAQSNAAVTGAATASPAGSLTVSGGTLVDQMNLINTNAAAFDKSPCNLPLDSALIPPSPEYNHYPAGG